MCAGCSTSNSEKFLPSPSPAPVKIPDICGRKLGDPVPLPAPVEGEDMGDIAAANRAALVTANKRIVGRDSCEAGVRRGFAGVAR